MLLQYSFAGLSFSHSNPFLAPPEVLPVPKLRIFCIWDTRRSILTDLGYLKVGFRVRGFSGAVKHCIPHPAGALSVHFVKGFVPVPFLSLKHIYGFILEHKSHLCGLNLSFQISDNLSVSMEVEHFGGKKKQNKQQKKQTCDGTTRMSYREWLGYSL